VASKQETESWLDDPKILCDVAEELEDQHRPRNAYNKAALRLYYERGTDEDGINWSRGTRDIEVWESMRRVGYNLIREVADGSSSQVCRPLRAKLVPVGLDAQIDRMCRTMNRILDGVFSMVKAHAVLKRSYRDSLVTDIGAAMLSVYNEEFRLGRLNPLYVLWPMDDTDQPRTILYEDAIPRRNLAAEYPEHAAAIKKLPSWQHERVYGVHVGGQRLRRADTVKVITAYATTCGKEKGQWVVSCEKGLVLGKGEWDYPIHPIITCRWDYDFDGFGGYSLARLLTPYHLRVTRNKRREDAFLAGAKPAIVAEESAAQDAKWSDEAYQLIVHPDGTSPPQVIMPPVIPPELIQSTDRDYQRARAEGGASETVTTGAVRSAVTSGRGIREEVSVSNLRLSGQHDNWTGLHTDLARVAVALGGSVKGKIRAKAPGAQWMEELKWPSAAQLKDEQYVVEYEAVSALPSTVSGKLDALEDLGKMGLANTADMARLSELPDIQRLTDALNGPLDMAEAIIDMAIVGDTEGNPVFVPVMALPTADLEQMHTRALQRLQQASVPGKNTPRANVECLRKLIRNIEARLKAAAPPPAPAMPGGGPGAPPLPAGPPPGAPPPLMPGAPV
jgi:hypothetical protein